MRVGLVYDRFGDTPPPPGAPPDWDAEYEPEETIVALEDALRQLGHQPVRLGSPQALLAQMHAGALDVDAAINIAESYGSRNREAHAPILLELAGIPCIGSDALALSVSLDKHLTKVIARDTGLATPDWHILSTDASSKPSVELAFPMFVKPRYEGTAKGIAPSSRCDDAMALETEAARQLDLYRQDLIAEAFVEGAEFTVGVIGTDANAEALPVLQRAIERDTGIGLHALADDTSDYDLPGELTPELEAALHHDALAIHRALECRDFSRSDFRVDTDGTVWFLEINPLPTFAPDGTFAILAELAGEAYEAFLARVLDRALYPLPGRSHRDGCRGGG
ncbi:MAG: D-alanine--D-alanine ligase [Rubricoccaceae bacterium]